LPGSITYKQKTRAVHYFTSEEKEGAIPEKQIGRVNNFRVEEIATKEEPGSGN
jgi:hypothetical protein